MKEGKNTIEIKIDLSKYPELKGIDLNNLFNPIYQFGEMIRKTFEQANIQLSTVLQTISDNHKKFPEETRKALSLLGEKGWYLPSMDFSMTLHLKLATELLKGEEDAVNNKMCELIESEFDDLSAQLIQNNPKRGKIILSACSAHNRGEYELSIPVFLTQVDGICKEKTGFEYFFKKNKKPKTAKFVADFTDDPFMAALLEPFRIVLPISESPFERGNRNIAFNRHQILHGEICNYDTKINSCKVFSLLNYIDSVLEMTKNKN